MAGPRITPDREAAIIAAIKDGRPAGEIHRTLHTCYRTIRRIAGQNGLTIASGQGPDVERLRTIYELDLAHGSEAAGKILGIHRASVSNAVGRYLKVMQRK